MSPRKGNWQRSKILFNIGSDVEHILEGTWGFFFSEIPSLKLAYPLKMDGWKTFSFPFWGWPIFSGVCGWFWGGEISPTGWCCYVPRSDGQRNHRPLENKAVRVRVKTIWRCISYLNNDHFPWPCYFTSTSVPQEIEKSSVFFPVWTLIPIWVSQMSRDHLIISPYLTWFLHVAAGVQKLPSCIKIYTPVN